MSCLCASGEIEDALMRLVVVEDPWSPYQAQPCRPNSSISDDG